MKIDDFYYLSRTALVKAERNLDKFDRVFAHAFKGLGTLDAIELAQIPEDWLKALTEKFLTEEGRKQIEALGGWEKLMEELKKRLEDNRHLPHLDVRRLRLWTRRRSATLSRVREVYRRAALRCD